jgi:hypothetical protein
VAFDEMFDKANLEHLAFERFKVTKAGRFVTYMQGMLILSGPGRGGNILKRWLVHDYKKAHNVWIEMAYFLPHGGLGELSAKSFLAKAMLN